MNKAGVPNRKFIAALAIALIAVTSVTLFLSSNSSPQPGSSITVNPSSSNWHMFRYDLSHAGSSVSTAPTSSSLLWNFTTTTEYNFPESQGREPLTTSLVIADGYLYCSGVINVYCLNASNGEKLWNYTTGFYVESSPAVALGYVYLGATDENVYCFDAYSGEKAWSFLATAENVIRFGVQSSPAAADGHVYFGANNCVHCLDAVTGDEVWEYAGNGIIGYNSPAVADGVLYITTEGGYVYAFK